MEMDCLYQQHHYHRCHHHKPSNIYYDFLSGSSSLSLARWLCLMLSLLSSSCFIVCIGLVLWKLCDHYCYYLMKCQCDENRGQTLYATRRREVEGTIKQIAKLTHLMRLEQRFDFDDIRLPRSATFADNDK